MFWLTKCAPVAREGAWDGTKRQAIFGTADQIAGLWAEHRNKYQKSAAAMLTTRLLLWHLASVWRTPM
jgi:hypothetical protein